RINAGVIRNLFEHHDIGKDLFGKENDIIRNRLSHHGVQGQLRKKVIVLKNAIDHYPDLIDALVASLGSGKIEDWTLEQAPEFAAYTLIQWALDGKKQGNGYGFPFDRPYLVFYRRLQTLYAQCEQLQQIHLHKGFEDNKLFLRVCRLLQCIMGDNVLHTAAEQLEKKALVFDKLRKAMRIADPMQNCGINDDGEDIDIKTIEKGVKEFRHWLTKGKKKKKNGDYQK
ncbi:MAG: ABC transporter substrate-binding protein, partial [Deltaproteobacteria bacterium]|nr:ABC transporter substrate-binding protein [Deltaproteobacteria bacterium]